MVFCFDIGLCHDRMRSVGRLIDDDIQCERSDRIDPVAACEREAVISAAAVRIDLLMAAWVNCVG